MNLISLIFIFFFFISLISTDDIKMLEFCSSSLAKTFEYESNTGFSVI